MLPKPQHAAAHIVTKLVPTHEIGEWHEPHGTTQHVAHVDETDPGIIYHARLGSSGVQLIRNDIAVCVPLELLFAMAGKINPKFLAPADKKVSARQVKKLFKDQ